MADAKITQLNNNNTIDDTDLVVIVDDVAGSPVTEKRTVGELKAHIGSGNVSKVGTPADNQVGVWTGDGTIEGDADLTFNGAGLLRVQELAGNGTSLEFYSTDGTPADLDYLGGIAFKGGDSGMTETTYAGADAYAIDVTDTTEDGMLRFGVMQAGTYRNVLEIGAESLDPINGISVGSGVASGVVSSRGNNDLILQTGNATTGSITITDGADGDITLAPNGNGSVIADNIEIVNGSIFTQTTNGGLYLQSNGAGTASLNNGAGDNYVSVENAGIDIVTNADAIRFSTDQESTFIQYLGNVFSPATSNTSSLGSATLQWSDLFLAEGGVINWDNGDATLTQTGNTVALAGANLTVGGLSVTRKALSVQVFDGGTDVTIGDGKAYITIPEALNGMNLVRAQATVVTAGTTNATTVQIHNKTDSQDMLSGNISIASAGTVGTVGTINTTYDDVATNDVLRIDVDAVSTTAPKGLMVVLEFDLA